MVAEVVPDCEVTFAAGASADTRDYRVDFTKIETTLPGYDPRMDVPRGIEQLYEAYRRRRDARALHRPAYFRLRTIHGLAAATARRRAALDDGAAR